MPPVVTVNLKTSKPEIDMPQETASDFYIDIKYIKKKKKNLKVPCTLLLHISPTTNI